MNVNINKVFQNPKNIKIHNKKNINLIKKSLLQFGQYKPIVVQKHTNIILAGNGTHQAAKELDWNEIWIKEIELSDQQSKLLTIVDNKSSELSEWDYNNLLSSLNIIPYEWLKDLSFEKEFMKDVEITIPKSDNIPDNKPDKPKEENIDDNEGNEDNNRDAIPQITCPNCSKQFPIE